MLPRIAIIGFGKRGRTFYKALNNFFIIEAVCDVSINFSKQDLILKPTIFYNDHITLLKNHASFLKFVIVCVPHQEHFQITMDCLNYNVHVLKEKPLALNFIEGREIIEKSMRAERKIIISTQRRFIPLYNEVEKLIRSFGRLSLVEGRYALNVSKLSDGWRAEKSADVLIDLGYHFIDLILWYFGDLKKISVIATNRSRSGQYYESNDTVSLQCTFCDHPDLIGQFIFTRNGVEKEERLVVIGDNGSLVLTNDQLKVFDKHKEEFYIKNNSIVPLQAEVLLANYFVRVIDDRDNKINFLNDGASHLHHMRLIERIYDIKLHDYNRSKKYLDQKQDFNWPIVTQSTEKAVIDQLHTTISIYDKSGIFEEFENKFAKYHNMKHALLCSSGTAALFSMFVGINLAPGDQVIVPAYTFYATASPLVILGVKAVPCDCLPDGNIDPKQIESLISEKTKAIVVTHMWGIPCDMLEILTIADKHKLFLLEDCSHAHGASIIINGQDRKVGSLGHAAIWSLQGQKIITGGEGGILLTNDPQIFTRALLLGHYNKRCKQEIPKDNELYKFALTGFGLKLRAHPLAIAIANEQFKYLDKWLKQKRFFAQMIIEQLKDLPFLQMPLVSIDKNPSWYAFVMQFLPERSPCSFTDFYNKLLEFGLKEIDHPSSTSPIYNLSLFSNEVGKFLPQYRMKEESLDQLMLTTSYPQADRFYQNAIKIPIWVNPEDRFYIELYIDTIKKVANEFLQTKIDLSSILQNKKLSNEEQDQKIIVAIIGQTGSGKTSLALNMRSYFNQGNEQAENCCVLHLDRYYRSQNHLSLEKRKTINYDVPDLIDYDLLISHIIDLKNGKEINMPQIDFAAYLRLEETTKVLASNIIIIEGSFVLADARLISLVDKTIFLSVPNDVCLTRILQRDLLERGRSYKDTIENYNNKIKPGFEKYVKPYKNMSDYVIKTTTNLDVDLYRLKYFILKPKVLGKGVFNMLKFENKIKIKIPNNSCVDLVTLKDNAKKEGVLKIVVGAVIYYNEKILILKRSATENFLPNLNELPSGTVEEGENLEEALFREIKEETSLEINSIEDYLGYFDYLSRTGKKTRQFTFDVIIKPSNTIKLNPEEHSEYFLYDPKDDLSCCNVTEQVQKIIKESVLHKNLQITIDNQVPNKSKEPCLIL